MKLALIVTAISALVFVGLGVAFLFSPASLSTLIDVSASSPTAMTDLRATYGGCQLGIGIFLGLCLLRRNWLEAALMLQAITLAGFATGRVLGIASDGPQQIVTYIAFTTEVAGVAIALISLVWLTRERKSAAAADVDFGA